MRTSAREAQTDETRSGVGSRSDRQQDQRLQTKDEHSEEPQRAAVTYREASDRIKSIHAHLEQQLQMRRTELPQLKNVGQNKGADEKNLVFMQQQLISAGKRREPKEQQLHELQDKRGALERDLQEKQAEDIIEFPNMSQFSQYVKNLKTKNDNYKKLQAEVGV
jgi:hypothetical protein